MSTILIRRQHTFALDAKDVAAEFAEATADIQAEFLLGLTIQSDRWAGRGETPWFRRSRLIAEELAASPKAVFLSVRATLQTLMDEIDEAGRRNSLIEDPGNRGNPESSLLSEKPYDPALHSFSTGTAT